ncbi:MAG: efflux RND transporter permease subunit [Rhodospirillales bacterium]|nr:efflux RND transporter permease subunit [Rhodospirillales bacterium]MBO6786341.1 efflux RND transporter permease subunit [Rhodospirillales bacterium]
MNGLIRLSIERPIAVLAAVLMVIMFGIVALTAIPIQLTPDVRKPIISLETIWPGAAPAEVEREITNEQEEVLKGIEGLEEISSESQDGRSRITMEFAVGSDMDRALLLTANRLDRVSDYPDEADQPSIRTASSEDNPIAWFVLTRTGDNTAPIHTFGDFAEDVIQDRLERVAGVARVNMYGSANREMVVRVDPNAMARYRLTVSDVVDTLRAANSSVSAGDVDEGKRRYVVRTEGEFTELEDVKKVVIRSQSPELGGGVARVTVGDVADVVFDYSDPSARIRVNGRPAIAMNTVRETGANVIETMNGIREAVNEMNTHRLPNEQLTLTQVYDETVYIDSSISLVQQNIVIGGLLAAFVLLIFLRSGGATLIVSMAIPVSVIGAFVAMAFLGRSLNVISLAGIAFAVGMVVDAAIVVLENIFRLREKGYSRVEAAFLGAKQVWVAVLVSAMTTVMVFIPILIMELEVGQLFRDIAVALSVSVLLSLLVAITVIPALSKRLLGGPDESSITRRRVPGIDHLAGGFHRLVMALTRRVIANKLASVGVVVLLCGAGAFITYALLPKLEYLPDGNRNLIIGYVVPPPGYNLDTMEGIASKFEAEMIPLLAENNPDGRADGAAMVERFFFVATRGITILGAAAHDPNRVKELIPILKNASLKEPGTFGLISQRSLFGRGVGGSRSIELNVMGEDMETILGSAVRAVGLVEEVLPRSEGTQLRPKPGLELGAPEVRVYPNRVKLADNGVTARQLSDTLDAYNDGLRVAEITVANKRIDLKIKGPDQQVTETQGINYLPVTTPSGIILPASELADIVVTSGPTQINHLERLRTVTLEIRPPDAVPLETALETLQTGVIDKLEAEGLPPGVQLRMSGTADSLNQTWAHMKYDLLIAVVIVYLVMAVLFESFIYPLVIMLSVPLATAGGVLGLSIMNQFTFQPLDMLTLLGFVILIGIVVNNAILLVHQTLYHMREEGMLVTEAILESTSNRIRPIFMSTTTSVFGMMPLVLFPGAGSELYRGLGSVVLGGLSLSAILTLAIIPPLMALFCAAVERNRDERLQRKADKDADDRKSRLPAIEDKTGESETIDASTPNRPQTEPNAAE